jgi:hypothetical protein
MFAALDDHLEPLITKLGLLAELDEEDLQASYRVVPPF